MKTMKKIVAITAAVLMLCSILPLSVFAADTTITFALGANGSASHNDGTSKTTYSETVDGYTLSITGGTKMYTGARDAKGNSCIKLGTSSAVGGFSFTVPEDVTSVIIAVGKYKTNTTKLNVNGTAYTLTKASNNGEYDEITVDTTSTKTVSLTTVSGGVRAMVNTISFVVPAAEGACTYDHDSLKCGETCPECDEYTQEHDYPYACTEMCQNGCGTANADAVAHTYNGDYAANCKVCAAAREVVLPTDPTEIVNLAYTIVEGDVFPANVTLTGIISKIDDAYSTQYNNITVTIDIIDANGNVIEGKSIKCYHLKGEGADIIAEGDTITVTGILKNYYKTIEFDPATLDSYEQTGCKHEYEYECSTTCSLCGKGEREAACDNDADYPCENGACNYCGNDVAALEHKFDDEWDPDCNYGCGYTREVEEKPEMTEATLDFSSTTQRTEYTTSIQVWENDGLKLTNNKSSSTSDVGNYSNPARFYKNSEIIISYSGMTQLVIDCSNTGDAKYSTPWGDILTAAGYTYTVEAKVYTVTFAVPVDSITLSCSAQVRANSMTATAVKLGDDECVHSWNAATCTAPATCALCGAIDGEALGHKYVEDIIDATCTANGTKTFECSVCFDSYDEVIPALGHTWGETACETCGAEKPAGYSAITGEQLVSGQYVLVVETGYAPTYFDADTKWVLTGKPDSDDGLLLETAGYLWTLTVNGSSVTITDANGVSIAPKGGDNNGIISGDYAWTWSIVDGYFVFSGVDSDTVFLASNTTANSGDNKFRGYKQSTCTGDNGASYKYKFSLYLIAADEPACQHEYDNACDVDCNLCYEAREVEHSVQHVAAAAATCAANGNIEYWYCDVCGMAWLNAECTMNTNLRAVVLPATGEHTYFDACSAICEVCGYEREVSHNIVHVAAAAATCVANGNIEYWYCDVCGMAWLNAECTMNTNLRAVITPATGEHTYDDEYDADCNVCGDVREVPEKPVEGIIYGDADGDGEITALDVLLLQEYFAGNDVAPDEVAADADGDGELTALDVLLLQEYFAGNDVVLGPPNDFNDGELEWGSNQ